MPPQCLLLDGGIDHRDCEAFGEIPDHIFRNRADHTRPFAGNGGVRFQPNPGMAEEFDEANALRVEMQPAPFRRAAGTAG